MTSEPEHSGDGELSPHISEEVGVKVIHDNLNVTVANVTPGVNVSVEPTATTPAPVLATERFIEIGKLNFWIIVFFSIMIIVWSEDSQCSIVSEF